LWWVGNFLSTVIEVLLTPIILYQILGLGTVLVFTAGAPDKLLLFNLSKNHQH
jgi:hypothetical protein